MGILGALWGGIGISILLGSAIWRLSPYAVQVFSIDLSALQWALLVANVIFMGVSEGYRGFQKGFSPRVAARTRYLRDHPHPLRTLLAPFFCMGYFHATRKRMIVSYTLTAGIVGLILLVRGLSQPWRGIVDVGVVVGLVWGLVAYWVFVFQAFGRPGFSYDPEVPAEG